MSVEAVEFAGEARIAPGERIARAAARPGARWVGIIAPGEPFEVYAHVPGPGCEDWGAVAQNAFVCLDGTTLAAGAPVHLPRAGYVYARIGRGKPGPVYASMDAWLHGKPIGSFERDHSYHFLAIEPTEKGDVLVAPDGKVVPVELADVFEPSPFTGRDLVAEPVPDGSTLAWCATREGCGPYAYQEAFLLAGEPPPGRVRRWRPGAAPAEVGAGELWVDVDLTEQTLTLVAPEGPVFATLIAAGTGGRWATPEGVFRVRDKIVDVDMISLPGSPDAWHVERVPFAVHIAHRIAIHGAFWHDKFGHPTSHGCINLSPADAHRVFDALQPELPDGWRQVFVSKDLPGTLVRVR